MTKDLPVRHGLRSQRDRSRPRWLRSCFWQSASTLIAASLAVLGCLHQPSSEVSTGSLNTPPNIVILFADDLGYGDLSSYGSPSIRTPNLDRLAAEGQRWTDFYAIAPVCSPSRAALLTGRLPVKSGQYGRRIPVYFPGDEGGLQADETTLAEVLRDAGYRTAIFGKWHLGDRKQAWPTRHGFDEWVGLPYSNDMDWELGPEIDEMIVATSSGDPLQLEELERVNGLRQAQYQSPKSEYWNVPLIESRRIRGSRTETRSGSGFDERVVERSPDQSLLTKSSTEQSLDFIERSVEEGKPFFLYVPYSMPHTPIFPSDEFDGRSRGGRYGDVVEEIDWSVGEIRRKLEDLEIADNTLVVFTSDNGPWLLMGDHGGSAGELANGKGTTFEGGMRVPGVFWWPGRIQPGPVEGEIGTAMDLYATAASVAGVGLSHEVDAVDLGPVVFGETAMSPRTELPFYRSGDLRAFRQGRYKIHFVTEGAYSMPPDRQAHDPPLLYDVVSDPGESRNLASEEPEILERVMEAARRHRDSVEHAEPLMDRRIAKALAALTENR